MKILNKKNIYELVPKLNLLLTISAVIMAIYLFLNLTRPYKVTRDLRMKQIDLTAMNSLSRSKAFVFDEQLFKSKQLFNEASMKSQKPKGGFVVLGVSIGEKNLAVIKDTGANKNYYCSEGESVGEYKVKQITKDKVVLESDGNILEINR